MRKIKLSYHLQNIKVLVKLHYIGLIFYPGYFLIFAQKYASHSNTFWNISLRKNSFCHYLLDYIAKIKVRFSLQLLIWLVIGNLKSISNNRLYVFENPICVTSKDFFNHFWNLIALNRQILKPIFTISNFLKALFVSLLIS